MGWALTVGSHCGLSRLPPYYIYMSKLIQMTLSGEPAVDPPRPTRRQTLTFPGMSESAQYRIDRALDYARALLRKNGAIYREVMADLRDIVREVLEEQVALQQSVEIYMQDQSTPCANKKRKRTEFGSPEAPIEVDKFVAWIDLCVDMCA